MPADPTPDLAALDALYQAATPGEWEADENWVQITDQYVVAECHDYFEQGIKAEPNAALIAALHNAWPGLLALAREALERRRDEPR